MSETVFAYGSNMCSARFRDYSVAPDGPGRTAVLKDHRLRFNKRSRDGPGKANVEVHEDEVVWGVLYTIRDEDLQILDAGEGPGYCRRQKQVNTSGAVSTAWVYFACEPSSDSELRPCTWYKRFLVDGAKEHGLPDEYVRALEQIEAIKDKIQQRDREKQELVCRTEMMILTRLLSNVDETLRRITASHLLRYDTLQRSLCGMDVVVNRDYQRTFNEEHSIGGARPQRKSAEWERPGAGTADRMLFIMCSDRKAMLGLTGT